MWHVEKCLMKTHRDSTMLLHSILDGTTRMQFIEINCDPKYSIRSPIPRLRVPPGAKDCFDSSNDVMAIVLKLNYEIISSLSRVLLIINGTLIKPQDRSRDEL